MNSVGKSAEDIACEYLEANGFTIIERNWRYHHLEVDIIALDKSHPPLIHFIEVKGRVAPAFIDPAEQVGPSKQKNLIRAAGGYLKKKKVSNEVVFDICTILFKTKGYEISFIKNAFTPLW